MKLFPAVPNGKACTAMFMCFTQDGHRSVAMGLIGAERAGQMDDLVINQEVQGCLSLTVTHPHMWASQRF